MHGVSRPALNLRNGQARGTVPQWRYRRARRFQPYFESDDVDAGWADRSA